MIDSPNPSEQGATPTLEEAARRRADLYQAILELEQAASRPAVAREEEWLTGVIEALDDLEGEILDHIEITERHDGLYAEIVEAAPRLSVRSSCCATSIPRCRRRPRASRLA